MTSDELTDKRMSHLVGISLILGFLLPHTATPFLLVNPLLCLFYQCFNNNRIYYKKNWLVLAPILLTLLINLPQGVTTKAMFSCLTLVLYFACFPMVGRTKIPNFYFYFILGAVLLSQVAYAFDISFMERILSTYYPISEEDAAAIHQQNTVSADNMLHFRLGGLFHNANQCARYLTFLLAGYMVLNSEKPMSKLLPFVLVAFYAVLLTGSRTGFVVASIFLIAYLFVDKRITAVWRVVAVVGSIAIFVVKTLLGSDTFRGFNVIQGFGNSANLKMDTFQYYLSSENSIFRLLLGYLDTSRFENGGATYYVMNSFDSDYGSIIFSYGFIGFVAILVYYFTIFRKLKPEGKVFFVLLLWMYSSAIVKSFRAVFLFMLLLSMVYGKLNRNERLK